MLKTKYNHLLLADKYGSWEPLRDREFPLYIVVHMTDNSMTKMNGFETSSMVVNPIEELEIIHDNKDVSTLLNVTTLYSRKDLDSLFLDDNFRVYRVFDDIPILTFHAYKYKYTTACLNTLSVFEYTHNN